MDLVSYPIEPRCPHITWFHVSGRHQWLQHQPYRPLPSPPPETKPWTTKDPNWKNLDYYTDAGQDLRVPLPTAAARAAPGGEGTLVISGRLLFSPSLGRLIVHGHIKYELHHMSHVKYELHHISPLASHFKHVFPIVMSHNINIHKNVNFISDFLLSPNERVLYSRLP